MQSKIPVLALFLASSFGSLDATCVKQVDLDFSTVSFAMHSIELEQKTNSTSWLCITMSSSPDYPLIFDLTRTCRSDGEPDEPCPDSVPYVINSEKAEWKDCRIQIQQDVKYQRCRFASKAPMQIYWDQMTDEPEAVKLGSGFSVRLVNQTVQNDEEYRLEVLDMADGGLAIQEAPTQNRFYVTFVLPIDRLKHLNQIKSGDAKCSYELLNGPMLNPSNTELYQLLFHIDDGQPLFGAPLDSSTYTLEITGGCSPTIDISLDEAVDWMNVTQFVCDGAIFLASQGYQSGFEDRISGYYMQRFVSCPDHLIDMDVNLTTFYDGIMTIVFLDAQQQPIGIETLTFDHVRIFPFTKTIKAISGAIFRWDKKSPFGLGFLLQVLVSKSGSTRGTIGTTLKAVTTKAITNAQAVTTTSLKPAGTTTTAKAMSTTRLTGSVATVTKDQTTTIILSNSSTTPTKAGSMSTITSLTVSAKNSLLSLLLTIVFVILFG